MSSPFVKERIELEHFVCPTSIFSYLAVKSSDFWVVGSVWFSLRILLIAFGTGVS